MMEWGFCPGLLGWNGISVPDKQGQNDNEYKKNDIFTTRDWDSLDGPGWSGWSSGSTHKAL